MNSTTRGSAFWLFVFGVALGGVLGAVLTHKYLTQETIPGPEAPVAAPSLPSANPEREDRFERILREWKLSPDDIRRQLGRAGQAIRREGGALTERLDEATLDPRIVAVIKAKFTLDAELSAWDVKVSSQEGHVTLSGTVNSPDLEVRAVVLALDTRGVVDVVSSLRVRPTAAPDSPPVER